MVDDINSTDRFVGGLENIDGNHYASGAISGGELVEAATNDREVQRISTNGESGLGVAMYTVADGESIAIAKVGAKVRAAANSTNDPQYGDLLTGNASSNGVQTAVSGDEVIGVAESDQLSGEIVMTVTGPGGDSNG